MTAHIYPRGSSFRTLNDIVGKKITVMGIGLNGGGEEAIRFFLKHSATVLATDKKEEEDLSPTIEKLKKEFKSELESLRLRFVLGEHRIQDFTAADLVIKNPGVKYENNKYLAAAKVIETDLSIFLALVPKDIPIIALTGSKGKSTTTRAIYDGLKAAGIRAFIAGNIGISPLTFFNTSDSSSIEVIVLELSSWQLADLRGRALLKPKIALITPIFCDHQDWYQNDMAAYVADKKLIYSEQDDGDWTICSFGNEDGLEWGDIFAAETKARVLRYAFSGLPQNISGAWFENTGTDAQPSGKIRLTDSGLPAGDTVLDNSLVSGKSARQNVLNAALVLSVMGVDSAVYTRFFSEWRGLEHRLEYFHNWYIAENNILVKFYNDTTATVPEAAASAIQAFDRPIRLICGGTDKELDFSPIEKVLTAPDRQNIRPASIYLLNGGDNGIKKNATREKLKPILDKHNIQYCGPYNSLNELLGELQKELMALPLSKSEKQHEELVVFSPGATSFGMFSNEFDRGNKFKNAVRQIFKNTVREREV